LSEINVNKNVKEKNEEVASSNPGKNVSCWLGKKAKSGSDVLSDLKVICKCESHSRECGVATT
jgi:hypothetical protein